MLLCICICVDTDIDAEQPFASASTSMQMPSNVGLAYIVGIDIVAERHRHRCQYALEVEAPSRMKGVSRMKVYPMPTTGRDLIRFSVGQVLFVSLAHGFVALLVLSYTLRQNHHIG
ncbi:hypothetical protein BHE74_00025474 [Ensete ventricosum]|nr:hypothetical protein BHE74_00025474 [Ensete ventricosum]RZS01953.1 hypothetical protein BHM03_00031914 [Ensete ventricosum]